MIAYLCVTDKDQKSHVRWHLCWDADRFVASQRAELAKEGSTVAVITEQEYRDAKWPDAPGKVQS